MAMFHRLTGYLDNGDPIDPAVDGTEIDGHQFAAAIREVARGNITRAQMETTFDLAPTDLDDLIDKNATITDPDPDTQGLLRYSFFDAVDDWVMLAEERLGITTEAIWDARISDY